MNRPCNLGKRRKWWGCLFPAVLLLFGLVGQLYQTAPAAAQESNGASVRQQDLDGDGQPDLTIITTSFASSGDEIRVYDGGRNMRWGEAWQAVTDFEDDTWVFDVGGDGSAQLVICFSRTEDLAVAALYSDQDDNGVVSLDVEGKKVHVTESPYPPLRVLAQGGWLLPDGQLNWNVRFQTDGPSVEHLRAFPVNMPWSQFMQLDGELDAELEFSDGDRDGVPEYGVWRLLANTPSSWGAVRTFLWANMGQHRPLPVKEYLFWPYLGTPIAARNYFDAPPAIVIDWATARIPEISFTGYPIEHGFHVHTLQYFEAGAVNYASFENAQAYYDLANDRDGYPELHIRHRYHAAGDPHNGNLRAPVNEIRWSWNQSSNADLTWDYKLGLAGRHTITSTMVFSDFSYLTIPYAELPGWVTGTRWDFATFVAREGALSRSSEGIYNWGAVESAVEGDQTAISRYLAGQIAVDIRQAFQRVPVGWRGELAPEMQSQPYLYFSSLDRKLHLRHAEYGIWEIDNQSQVRLADQDRDGYLDQWRYLVDEALMTELDHVANHLVYAGDDRVLIKETAVSPVLFETLPPRDHQEWLALGEQLEAQGREFAPGDFEAMVAQFDGPQWHVSGATLRDFRPTETGFRFVLTLEPDFRVDGSGGPELDRIEPGRYVVDYSGSFEIQPSSSPELQVTITLPEESSANEFVSIQVGATNEGLEDATDLILVIDSRHDGETTEIARQAVDLLAGEPVEVTANWQPLEAGDWEIAARLEDAAGTVLAESQMTLSVLPTTWGEPAAILAGTSYGALLPILGLLVAGTLLAAAVWGATWSKGSVPGGEAGN